MIGGKFLRHPCVREITVSLNDPDPGIENHITHPITRDMRGFTIKDWEPWPIFEYRVSDEQYLLDYDPRVTMIASTIYKGNVQPVAWTKTWGEGRVMYTILGHHMPAVESYVFKELFVNGCRWAVGLIHEEEDRENG